ncbi:MAG: tetratricopeptide repeat protein [Treponema sp.]|jgi:tetratricopeptide (TPR) repeat protein|nr:tetratricopeptide repeat protein [Treponema sp.]
MAARDSFDEGKRLFHLKRWEMALQEFLMVDSGGFSLKESVELSYYLGLCYTKLARYDDGLLYMEQVITQAENSLWIFQCRMVLAYIYVMTKRYKMAEFELEQLATSGFQSAQMYTSLAYSASAQKQYDRAMELYQKALDLDRDNTTALNGLGYILVDTEQDIIKGMEYCRKAVNMKPRNAAYLDSMGWAAFKTGDTSGAKNWLRKALGIAPNEPEIQNHLKMATGGIG